VPPVDGLLLKVPITGTCPAGGLADDAGGDTVIQPGMRISKDSNDNERKTNFFTVVTSNYLIAREII
jgi:hypothetical protein